MNVFQGIVGVFFLAAVGLFGIWRVNNPDAPLKNFLVWLHIKKG